MVITMANYTPNYGLHQWESGDHFQRTDFNTDFAKIDTAIKQSEVTAATRSDQIAAVAEAKCRVVAGIYTGTGGVQTFDLGGYPFAVLVEIETGSRSTPDSGAYAGLAVRGGGCGYKVHDINVVPNGFQVSNSASSKGTSYYYIAFLQ